MLDAIKLAEAKPEAAKEVIKEGLSEYFLFTIDGREDIEDQQPKRLVSMKVADGPLECIYKLTDRDGGWSYFPDLPELPPDLDSLSAAMTRTSA